ncbi:MAG: redox-sensing transcriptional repressor Rex [Bacteroidales bacterium]|jgi:redox-sensing transcriptional repressor
MNMEFPSLPPKTVERLSQYRRILISCSQDGRTHIFSHELAAKLSNTPVQVRRDIMLVGYTGNLRKGYDVLELAERIGEVIDACEILRVALIGAGKLGTAVLSYFKGKRSKIEIVACFDVAPEKLGKRFEGVLCYHQNELPERITELNISMAILALPTEFANDAAKVLVENDIKGILNYTSANLNIPETIYLEQYDMVTSIEKVAYFVKQSKIANQ